MKNLLKTSALAAVLALSANSANAAAGFETSDSLTVNMIFADAIAIYMDPTITFDNLVAGDQFEVTTEVVLDHDSDRHTSCQIATSATLTADTTGTAINDANGIVYILEMTDASSNTLDVHIELQDQHDCDGVDIHATAAETTTAVAGSTYTGSFTIEAAYDVITGIDIDMAILTLAVPGGAVEGFDSTASGTVDQEFGLARTLNFSTDASGELDADIAYNNAARNLGDGDSTSYQVLNDGSSTADSSVNTEFNGYDLDGLTSGGSDYTSSSAL